MKVARLRLIVAVLLFAGWIGYLAYLVYTLPRTPAGAPPWGDVQPLVLSEPQILVSELDVVARVESKNAEQITVEEVLYPPGKNGLVGKTLAVTNLAQCHAPARPGQTGRPEQQAPGPDDFVGPGPYLLPLHRLGNGKYEVVPIPGSPGYPPPGGGRSGPPRIYPFNSHTLAQYRQIRK